MNDDHRNKNLAHLLLTLICMQLPLNARAAETPELKAQEPTMETAAPRPSTMLNGAITRLGGAENSQVGTLDANGQPVHNVNASASNDTLRSQTPAPDLYDQAIKKLRAQMPLTAEDYRHLEIGVAGYQMYKNVFLSGWKVTEVYPRLPADQAGIQVGDIETATVEREGTKFVGRYGRWFFTCGKAGSSFDVTVKRHKERLTFTITRMNIEDIPDNKLRKAYEKLVRETGARASKELSLNDL